MAIINSFISWINAKRLKQIEEAKTYPGETQDFEIKELIRKVQDTEWGKRYGYCDIKTIHQFQQRVPVNNYDDLKPYIQRMVKGEKNVLWPTDIRWFAKSSGTTNDKSKYIPISQESLEECHYKAAKDAYVMYFEQNPESKLHMGKGLTLGGSHKVSKLNAKSHVGDLSAVLIQNLPFIAEFKKTPNSHIALLSEFEEKINKIAEVSIQENVTSIVGVPSWNLILLKHILKVTGKDNILDIWPNLELFVHGGISFDPYRDQFLKLFPSDQMHYMETYNASEGFFALQDRFNNEGMLLMLDYGIFYEFIPMDEIDKKFPKAYTITEVEKDVNYALAITTNGGLCRYLIGDTIKFVSTNPHRIVITGRTKHYINAFGEELMVDNAEKAMSYACSETGASINDYTAAPVYISEANAQGRHQWLIQFEKMPSNKLAFATLLDNKLQQLNSDYEAKRHKNITLECLEIIPARPNLFMDWLKQKGKLGGQNKVPRLSNSRKYIDQLLEMNSLIVSP